MRVRDLPTENCHDVTDPAPDPGLSTEKRLASTLEENRI